MPFRTEKDKILLAMDPDAGTNIRRTIGENRAFFMRCSTMAEVRQIIALQMPDMLIMKLPIKGGSDEDAIALALQKQLLIILLVDERIYDRTVYRMRDAGVFVLPCPYDERMLYESYEFVMQAHWRIAAIEEENKNLKAKLLEQKLIARAKGELMNHEGMSEQESHTYLQKYAMDHSLTMGDASRQILSKYSAD